MISILESATFEALCAAPQVFIHLFHEVYLKPIQLPDLRSHCGISFNY